jgi:hypothetical protein
MGGLVQTATVRPSAYVVNNQRFCILPQGRRPNLAFAVLARTLRRLSSDYKASYGHPVLVVEMFTDPARHRGSCYAAAGFAALGQTLGYRRSAGAYIITETRSWPGRGGCAATLLRSCRRCLTIRW